MQYELRGHKLYQRILAHAAYQQRVLVFSVTRNFGRVNIARYFFFHETLSREAGAGNSTPPWSSTTVAILPTTWSSPWRAAVLPKS